MKRLVVAAVFAIALTVAAPSWAWTNFWGYNWMGPNSPTTDCSQFGNPDPGEACSSDDGWNHVQYTSNTNGSTYCIGMEFYKADLSVAAGAGEGCGVGTFTGNRQSVITGTNFASCDYISGGASYIQCRVST
jgi:hypothetical protein